MPRRKHENDLDKLFDAFKAAVAEGNAAKAAGDDKRLKAALKRINDIWLHTVAAVDKRPVAQIHRRSIDLNQEIKRVRLEIEGKTPHERGGQATIEAAQRDRERIRAEWAAMDANLPRKARVAEVVASVGCSRAKAYDAVRDLP